MTWLLLRKTPGLLEAKDTKWKPGAQWSGGSIGTSSFLVVHAVSNFKGGGPPSPCWCGFRERREEGWGVPK
jgi:hypothetical protein